MRHQQNSNTLLKQIIIILKGKSNSSKHQPIRALGKILNKSKPSVWNFSDWNTNISLLQNSPTKEHNGGWLCLKNYSWVLWKFLPCPYINLANWGAPSGAFRSLLSLTHFFVTAFFCICDQVKKKGPSRTLAPSALEK